MSTTQETGFSYVTYEAESGDSEFVIPFGYLDTAHVRVLVNGAGVTQGVEYNIPGSYLSPGGGTVVFTEGNEPEDGDTVKVYRRTSITRLFREFPNGTALTGDDLTRSALQSLYGLQELWDGSSTGIPGAGFTEGDVTIVISGPGEEPELPGDVSASDVLVFLNGVLVHPADFTLTPSGDTTTLALNVTITAGDVLLVRNIKRGGVLNIDLGSVTAGAIADGAVETDKLADNAVTWGKLSDNAFTDWDSLEDTDGPQTLLEDLNSRLEALEAVPAASGSRISRKTTTTATTATAYSSAFSFTPDYVLIIHGAVNSTSGGVARNVGANFVLVSGDSSKRFIHSYGNDSDGANIDITSASLSGATVSFTHQVSTANMAGGTITILGIKETA